MTTHNIIPTQLAIKAMRDNGYKNAAYAVAELADNSIQAGASQVELLCIQEHDQMATRRRSYLTQVAICDNGCGMNAEVLRMALQFGNGTRLNDRSGIGRFGMGLPNSSLSQAKRVEVYTWQGFGPVLYSYLDVDEISSGTITNVPEPIESSIPEIYINTLSSIISTSKSGTLVIWTKLDRLKWSRGSTLFSNSEPILGRIYRYQITDQRCSISMKCYELMDQEMLESRLLKPNDPLYLMSGTTTPYPWSDEAMFKPYTEFEPHIITCHTTDERGHRLSHEVRITCSIFKEDSRIERNAGSTEHGKHAAKNQGVSVMRADRELEMQTSWTNNSEPRERWWGVEIDFPPELDEVFGVNNSKQAALTLNEFGGMRADVIADQHGFNSIQELKEHWLETNDSRLVLLETKLYVDKMISLMRKEIDAFGRRQSTQKTRHVDTSSAEYTGTQAIEQRKNSGQVGLSDTDENAPSHERVEAIQASIISDDTVSFEEANRTAQLVVDSGVKFLFQPIALGRSGEFFSVRPTGGILKINLNTQHPVYKNLISILEIDNQVELSTEQLREKLRLSSEGLKLLLEAWARYEDELPEGPKKELVEDVRLDWGRVARSFFRND